MGSLISFVLLTLLRMTYATFALWFLQNLKLLRILRYQFLIKYAVVFYGLVIMILLCIGIIISIEKPEEILLMISRYWVAFLLEMTVPLSHSIMVHLYVLKFTQMLANMPIEE